jgi:hypothetical protein
MNSGSRPNASGTIKERIGNRNTKERFWLLKFNTVITDKSHVKYLLHMAIYFYISMPIFFARSSKKPVFLFLP